MKRYSLIAIDFFLLALFASGNNFYAQPLKVGVVGLHHDHAYGLM